MDSYRFNHHVPEVGEMVESDVIIADADEWRASPESRSGAWSTISVAGRVIANRLAGVPVVTQASSRPAPRVDP